MIVYFIRGRPGSGKTSLAEDLVGAFDAAGHTVAGPLEADNWMLDDKGQYAFDFRNLPLAHARCLAEYERAIRDMCGVIIVSNTSTLNSDVDRYQDIAVAAGYEFVSIVVENRAGTKSIHNVPEETMARMLKKFELKL